MTVETQTNYVIHTGNSVATQFPYTFRLPEMSMVEVFLLHADTNAIIRQLGFGEFSITGVSIENYDGGQVTYPLSGTPIGSDTKILIQRTAAYTQGLDLENEGGFYPESLEYQLDKLEFQIQQLRRDVNRSILTPLGASPVPDGHFFLSNGDGTARDGGDGSLISDAEGFAERAEDAADRAEAAAEVAEQSQPQSFPPTRAAVKALADTVINAYLTEPGYEGYLKQVDPNDYLDLIAADTVGGDINVSTSNPNLAWLRQRKYGDLIYTSEFGHNLPVALAAAAERAKLFGPGARVDLVINQTGTLALTSGLQAADGVNFFSDRNLELDPSGLDYGDFYDSSTGLKGTSGRTIIDVRPIGLTSRADHYSTALPEFNTISPGDMVITYTSAHGRKVGDVIVLYDSSDGSWFSERTEYRLSMRRRVTAVDGLVVHLDKPARDVFTYSATCKSYVQTTLSGGRFGGWRINAEDTAIIGLQAVHLLGLDERTEVSDIVAIGAMYSGIALAQCFNIQPKRLRGGTKLGQNSDVYPIQIQNCTEVEVFNSEGWGAWHTLAMTGAGGFDVGQSINEDCWFRDCKAYNNGGSPVGSIEMHGNADGCGFENCRASEAILSGRDATILTGVIDNAQSDVAAQGKLIYIGEQHSGRFLIQGTQMRSRKNTGVGSTSGAIYCYTGDNQKGEIFVDFEGVYLDAPLEQLPILIGRGISNNAKFSFSFDGVVNVPAATTYGLVRVPNTDDGVATNSYFCINRADGLTNGVPWADFGGTTVAAFYEMSFPRQTVDWVTSNAGLPAEVSPVIPWKHGFPRGYVPKISAQIQKGTLGPKANAHGYAVTNTGVQAEVATGDATNMVATATLVLIEGY